MPFFQTALPLGFNLPVISEIACLGSDYRPFFLFGFCSNFVLVEPDSEIWSRSSSRTFEPLKTMWLNSILIWTLISKFLVYIFLNFKSNVKDFWEQLVYNSNVAQERASSKHFLWNGPNVWLIQTTWHFPSTLPSPSALHASHCSTSALHKADAPHHSLQRNQRILEVLGVQMPTSSHHLCKKEHMPFIMIHYLYFLDEPRRNS